MELTGTCCQITRSSGVNSCPGAKLKASSALLIRSAKGSLFPGVLGHSLVGLGSAVLSEDCPLPVRDPSFSTTPFNHDVWFSLFVWPGLDGDLNGDLEGDFAGLCSTLSSHRKAFNLVRDFDEIGYESNFLDMAAVKSWTQYRLA